MLWVFSPSALDLFIAFARPPYPSLQTGIWAVSAQHLLLHTRPSPSLPLSPLALLAHSLAIGDRDK